MFSKRFLKFLALQIRMYNEVLGDSPDTTFYTEELNKPILDIMKELIEFGGM